MIKPLILDINSGNILSLKNIILKFSKNVSIGNNDNNILNATHIFLPGVGSYSQVMQNVKNRVNIKLLKKKLLEKEAMFLGICVGMQVLSEGLSLIKGSVKKWKLKRSYLTLDGIQ